MSIKFEHVVIVCGGRNYQDKEALWAVLDEVWPTTVIAGGAQGADHLAELWAADRGVSLIVMPALWKAEGKSAGPRRNKRMAEVALRLAVAANGHDTLFPGRGKPSLVAAPGGKGTANMRDLADRLDWEIIDV